MKRIDRRTFLKHSLTAAATLGGLMGIAGCGTSQDDFVFGISPKPTATPTPTPLPASLFPGEVDPPDLTAVGEIPPTEIPRPERFFGNDVPFAGDVPQGPNSFLDTFDHVVVLQLENRSLDNLLGYLYPTGQSPKGDSFDGVSLRNFTNPIPSYAPGSERGTVPVSKSPGLQNPVYDPAEQWTAVNLALYNQFNPPSNRFAASQADFIAPYNLPNQGATFPAPMDGFVTAFYWRLLSVNQPATYEDYSTVMQCFPPSLVPAISQLAQNFAVCDNWHCGVPSQTYTNRAFLHAASASGFLVNSPVHRWPFENTAPTIFESLSQAGQDWTVYYDGLDILPFTRVLHYPRLKQFPDRDPYFKDMTRFYEDVENGRLPAYSFIQPRFVFQTNSYHPDKGAPAVKRGEILVNDIYQAIRQSNSIGGSNFLNTLFIITFDEGGTTFDHVPPPAATPPGDGYVGQYDFAFDRLGQRIPTILVSPWLSAGTVVSTPLDANSLMRTLQEKFLLDPLNARDSASTSLAGLPFNSTPRDRSSMPRLQLRKLSADEAQPDLNRPPGDLSDGFIRMVNAIATGSDDLPSGAETIGGALEFLRQNRPA